MTPLSSARSSRNETQSTWLYFSENYHSDTKSMRFPDRVFDYVITRICNGTYLPGSKINEMQISRELGVSIIPVRETMEKIVHIGLVERIPNKGVCVQKWSLQDLEDIYEMRLELETSAIRKIADTITDGQLQQLKQVVEIRKPADDVINREFSNILTQKDESHLKSLFMPPDKHPESKIINAEVCFHMLLIRFTGNCVREQMAELVLPRAILNNQFHFYLLPYSILAPLIRDALQKNISSGARIVSHEDIYQALKAHHADEAERLMREHLKLYYQINKAKIDVFGQLNSLSDILRKNEMVIE